MRQVVDLSKYLVRIQIYVQALNLLDLDRYLANPGEFKKRLTPLLAKCAMNTPKTEGRIRWQDFITYLPDEGVTELFWVLKDWHDERGNPATQQLSGAASSSTNYQKI